MRGLLVVPALVVAPALSGAGRHTAATIQVRGS
jgi:hypothetical protein